MTKTVLYIDDSLDDLFFFHRACQAAGVSFLLKLVDGSDMARKYLTGLGEYADRGANPLPDFILLDIKMPEMDGFEMLNWIRAHAPVSNMMVALYSSSMVDKDVLRGYLGGTTFYIPKSHGTAMLGKLARALDDCLKSDGRDCAELLKLSLAPAKL